MNSRSKHLNRRPLLRDVGITLALPWFGAGIGILMVSSLSLMGLGEIHCINAVKAGGGHQWRVGAAVPVDRAIVWKYALLMAGTAILGSNLTLRSQEFRQRWVTFAPG